MRKQRLTMFTLGIGVLILMVVFFFASTTIRRSDYIRLPDRPADSSGGGSSYEDGASSLPLLEITPKTVQTAIATLSRPESYQRSVEITTYWSGGSATDVLEVAVKGELTRIDEAVSGGSIRHLLTNGIRTAVWFDEESDYALLSAGSFSADMEQRVPTYEDILALDVAEIAIAVYGVYEGIDCISVLTAEDEWACQTAYWISLESGLLVGAEIRQEDTLIYKMTSLGGETVPEDGLFLLPDGGELPVEAEETDEKEPPEAKPVTPSGKPPVVADTPEVASPSDLKVR